MHQRVSGAGPRALQDRLRNAGVDDRLSHGEILALHGQVAPGQLVGEHAHRRCRDETDDGERERAAHAQSEPDPHHATNL